MSKYVVMYSLYFSVCGYQTFRRVQDLKMNRLTILLNKIYNENYLSYTDDRELAETSTL